MNITWPGDNGLHPVLPALPYFSDDTVPHRQVTRAAVAALLLLALCLLPGCWIYSVHPLADNEDDLIFDKALLGKWTQDSGCSLEFSRFFEEKTYRVVYASPPGQGDGCLLDAGQSAAFEGRMVEIGGFHFLDVLPADRTAVHHAIRVHSFYRLSLQGDKLALLPLNHDWFKDQISTGKVALAARDDAESPGLVLTSTTADLRAFLRDYAGNDRAFTPDARLSFHRRSEP